jgi:hypothetical protein
MLTEQATGVFIAQRWGDLTHPTCHFFAARFAAFAFALASNCTSRFSMALAMRCSCFALMHSRMNDSQTSADKPMVVFLDSMLDLDPADTARPRRR